MRYSLAMGQKWISCGALLGFLAVAAGAFGAHLLETKIPVDHERLAAVEHAACLHDIEETVEWLWLLQANVESGHSTGAEELSRLRKELTHQK